MSSNIEEGVDEMEQRIRWFATNNNHIYRWSENDFDLGTMIGFGTFGQVYAAREKHTGYLVAMKILSTSKMQKCKNSKEMVRKEIDIQMHLRHPHILKLLISFPDSEKIYIITEYAEYGALVDLLNATKYGYLPQTKAARYLYQITDAVDYCHQRKVIHRDIKPENVMVFPNDILKLGDFGLATYCRRKLNTPCGTMSYMAPEVANCEYYDFKADIWSIGVLLFVLLAGRLPFGHLNRGKTQLISKIVRIKYTFPDHINVLARDLITKILKKDSSERLSLKEIQHHPWTKKYLKSTKK